MIDATPIFLLKGMASKLLQHLSGDGKIIIEEMDVPGVPAFGEHPARPALKTFMTSAAIRYPTFGDTRAESLGWMVAQALYALPRAHPLALETHELLVRHGLKIPTREEYQRATAMMRCCQGENDAP